MQVRKKDTSAIQNAVLGADGPLPDGAIGAKLLSLVTHINLFRFLVNTVTGTTALQGREVQFLQPGGKS